jgi:nitroimidazol reductase NimA-like FMN-containing flavoprotein (pyridoxamine 5'-phosphate oxidase superfamily)
VRRRRTGQLRQATLYAIVDDAYLCHIAFRDDKGRHCIPTACWRIGGHLYIHGSNGSRMLKQLLHDTDVCVTVTHLDGLVLARSAFNHTMNYRSAMIYGQFEKVADIAGQHAAMDALMEKLAPGRLPQVRGGSDKNTPTTVLRIALDECAVKQRKGGPLTTRVTWHMSSGRASCHHARSRRCHRRCAEHQRDTRLRRRMGRGIRLTVRRAWPMIGIDGDSQHQTHQ